MDMCVVRRQFQISSFFVLLAFGVSMKLNAEDSEQPITAVEARKEVDQTVYVELTVKAAKDRLEKRGEIYLDSEEDFRDEKNLGTVITRDGAAEFRRQGINDPAEHFRNKKIRVRGTVIIKDESAPHRSEQFQTNRIGERILTAESFQLSCR